MLRMLALVTLLSAIADVGAAQWLVPVRIEIDAAGNGILEPNEGVAVHAYWRNVDTTSWLGGAAHLSDFSGPTGPTYAIEDGSAFYGEFAPGGPARTCEPTDCYAPVGLRISATARPAAHWDATVHESMAFTSHTWRLHVGATFTDVPTTSAFYRSVETIVHKDVTGGCSATAFCPAAPVSREAMAVFLGVAREPRGYLPPPCGALPLFSDVPASSPFCRWIEHLARQGATGGCGGGRFCPTAAVTRQEMAVLLLAAPGYTPPPCLAAPYADVPVSSPYCPWIARLTAMGVTTGCGNGNYCPTAEITRAQMSAFLTTRFRLTLGGLF